MSRMCCTITVKLLSDTIFSSGNSIPGGEDIALRTDAHGAPIIPAATIKGMLRESVENYLCWTGQDDVREVTALFGKTYRWQEDTRRRLVFSDLRLHTLPWEDTDWSSLRTFIRVRDGMTDQGSLRMAACLDQGLVFSGLLLCDQEDFPLLETAVKGIRWAGLMHHRGFGSIEVRLQPGEELKTPWAIASAPILRYRLRVKTPLSIPWLSRSGIDSTDGLRYTKSRDFLPGSAVRGMVMSALSQSDDAWFQENKEALLKKVRFWNAVPVLDGKPLIPTPAGFYEDKAGTRFYSILNREAEAGDKRARLGSYCSLEGGILRDHSPAMTSGLRILKKKRRIFSVQAIAPETVLEGYIHLDDPNLASRICTAFGEYVWLGADRYAGNGLCQVECLDAREPELYRFSYGPGDTVPQDLCMMLLSPAAMFRNGEPAGIDEEQLAALLDVGSVTVTRCATSLTEAAGFNRTLGCKEPSVTMYEAGSVFCLHCDKAPTWEALRSLERSGIGIRRPEGYGQVLFLKDLLSLAQREDPQRQDTAVSNDSLCRQARCRWLLDGRNQLPRGLSNSQMVNIQGLMYGIITHTRTMEELEQHFRDKMGRQNNPRLQQSYRDVYYTFQRIWQRPIGETLSWEAYPDSLEARLQLLCDWINLRRKERTRK